MPTNQNRDNWLNYNDWAKATNNGETKMAVLGREFDNATTLASDLPFKMATGKFEDRGTFKDSWEKYKHSRVTDVDGVYIPSKTGTYTRYDIMGMRNASNMFNVKDLKQMTADQESDYRTDAAKDKMKFIALDIEADLIYANPLPNPSVYNQANDVRNCLGLAPRYNKITDHRGIYEVSGQKHMSPYITLDAGGTGDGLTSAWLIVPSATNGVCRLMSSGTQFTGNISVIMDESKDGQLQEGTDAVTGEKGYMKWKMDTFDVVYGIAILNRRACIRIANINMNDDTSIAKFIKQYRYAVNVIDRSLKSDRHNLYMNPDFKIRFEDYIDSRKAPTSYSEAMPHVTKDGENMIGNWYIRECEQILTTEEQIV